MDLSSLSESISEFNSLGYTGKIELFTWHLLAHQGKAEVKVADVVKCFHKLNLAPPANPHDLVKKLFAQKRFLARGQGYVLESSVRKGFDAKYGQRAATIQVHQLLSTLPAKLVDLSERTYLDEALICFKAGAFRASIVMTWNLVYSHLSDLIINKHLAAFNAKLARNPKAKPVVTRDDLALTNEKQVLELAYLANVTTKAVNQVLEPCLVKRNQAAHPSGVSIDQLIAESYISDLINNALLKL